MTFKDFKYSHIQTKPKTPVGKGNWRKVYYITKKGKRLLEEIGDIESE